MSTHASRVSRLSSPRFVRTFSWISGLVLIAGVITFAVVKIGHTGKTTTETFRGKAQVASPVAPTVKLDPTARRVAGEFITTAVTRQHLDRAWAISHPELRAGLSRKEWMSGTLPVQPFPANAIAGADFKVEESHPREATLRVLIVAKPSSGVRSQDFFITLKAVGEGKAKRWLVSYWIPVSGGGIVPNVGSNS
jgi:hypothetical protein